MSFCTKGDHKLHGIIRIDNRIHYICYFYIQTRRSSLPRLFVALYDYDPISQSPNEDAAEVKVSVSRTVVIDTA